MMICTGLLVFSKAMGLSGSAQDFVFDCLYAGGIAFFVSASSHFFLDIMYGIFGLMQVKVAGLLAWLGLSILSLLPLAAILAAMRLALGFQA